MPSIAVVGGGIAGMYAAYRLDRLGYAVQLFEAGARLGGHTDTHLLATAQGELAIDTGFIVFNRKNYPLFAGLLDELEVPTQPSSMSFSVHHEQASGYEYAAARSGGLFSQRRNLINPSFWRMLLDIVRFYRAAQRISGAVEVDLTLGDYLAQAGYSHSFAERHILPMTAALWSCSLSGARQVPLAFVLDFMAAHDMLQINNRPEWEVVKGGSQSYVKALCRHWSVQVHCAAAVTSVRRKPDCVELQVAGQRRRFDGVVMACHSDQALAMLADPSQSETDVLGAIGYAQNEMALHTDISLLPRNPRAWASWNARIPANNETRCIVSYWMNLLQSLPAEQTAGQHYITSLNQTEHIDPERILLRRQYAHPVIDRASQAAVKRWPEINGQQRTWYCGAYWGWGFHEDGARSAARAVADIQQHSDARRWALAS